MANKIKKEQQQAAARSQVSVAMDDGLRERLEAAARREIRSLAGEIVFRLKKSLEAEHAGDARRIPVS